MVGVWRVPDAPGWFTPAPDRAHRIWYSRDVASIARADGVKPAAPALIEADATPNPGGWPKGGQTVVAFRNEHLQYAVTWFLMAAGLLVVYIAYHVSRGRLGLEAPRAARFCVQNNDQHFVSTRRRPAGLGSPTFLLAGLAPDGGVPAGEAWPPRPPARSRA